ncbi:hypothetical protein FE789_21710 [Burkholderia pseudomallei]|nr:hypothetical protein FE789_21710 [Burkholderia pseudomallei]
MHHRYAAQAAARFVVQPSREGWPIRRKPARHTHSSALASHRIHRKKHSRAARSAAHERLCRAPAPSTASRFFVPSAA